MADYSHLRARSLPAFAELLDGRWRPFDEYLFEAVGFITPPLLDQTQLEALRRYFWPGARTRGRPRKDPIDRLELANVVKATRRCGPAGAIARELHRRLLANEPHSVLRRWERDRRFHHKQFQRAVIKHLSDEYGEMLENGLPYRHRELGELDLGTIDPSLTPREHALTAAQNVMRTRLGLHPPDVRSMANVASAWANTRWFLQPSSRNCPQQASIKDSIGA